MHHDEAPASAQPTRGLTWASNAGFGGAILGLLIVLYAYYRATSNPDTYAPGTTAMAGWIIFLLGLAAGVAFNFVPIMKRKADTAAMEAHVKAAGYMVGASRIIAWVGVGLVVLGLLLTNYIWSKYAAAPAGQDTLTLAGTTLAWTTWTGAFLAISLVGGFLWAVFLSRAGAYDYARRGYERAVHVDSMTPPPATTSGAALPVSIAGVNETQVIALMKRLDGMLALLPENQVATFSKSPEAETYLKLLGHQVAAGPAAPPGNPLAPKK